MPHLKDVTINRRNVYKINVKKLKGLYHVRLRDFGSSTDLDYSASSY